MDARLYLRQVAATPLLSADEERALAAGVAAGDPEARDRLVRANLRLVVSIARSYRRGRGLGLEDLVAEGNLGLIRAAEGFDPAAGVRFSTYAAFWIRQSIRRALMLQGRAVRLPAHMVALLARWSRAAAALADRLGCEPTAAEVGAALGLPARKAAMVEQALRAHPLQAGGDDGDTPPEELLVDDARTPAELLSRAEELERLRTRLGRLGPREAAVVRLRYGLDDGGARTLQEIGAELGLTRERIRQLAERARRQLAG